ncbi:hypothetical protein BU251_05805 [Candidatus Velamenicoccus archaeovorus]|uniref:Uncharacterized protein n=1 Tax=Velamenicoccus archaeovorus TaxID=1930593 RepID=A0A410P5B7_VELA1|nr:hypothetical protein BU251_05805 [Candidatus Velamenicoccus archaeovorus]
MGCFWSPKGSPWPEAKGRPVGLFVSTVRPSGLPLTSNQGRPWGDVPVPPWLCLQDKANPRA